MIEMKVVELTPAEADGAFVETIASLGRPFLYLLPAGNPFKLDISIRSAGLAADKLTEDCPGGRPLEIDITGKLDTKLPAERLCWQIGFPSGQIHSAYADMVEKNGKTFLSFRAAWALMDPARQFEEGDSNYQVTLTAFELDETPCSCRRGVPANK